MSEVMELVQSSWKVVNQAVMGLLQTTIFQVNQIGVFHFSRDLFW